LADNYFYLVAHRLFHQIPWLYSFHKFHHEYDSVFSLILQHVNPVEGIFANLVSFDLFRFLQL
jgi:sterol desaturase/sphingolipid hydroxylase (fatty acid hydroxylase superfamily)